MTISRPGLLQRRKTCVHGTGSFTLFAMVVHVNYFSGYSVDPG